MRRDRLLRLTRLTERMSGRRRALLARGLLLSGRVFPPGRRRAGDRAILRGLGYRARGGSARPRAVAQLAAAGTDARLPLPTRVQLARMCLDLDDAEAATRVIASLPPPGDGADGGAARHVLESELLRRSAHYPEAQAAATRAVRLAPGSAPAQRALARAKSALAVRTPGWRPSLGGGGVTGPGTRGRILHVVSNALPEQQTGYTLRTQAVALCQLEAGLDPWVATRREGARAVGWTVTTGPGWAAGAGGAARPSARTAYVGAAGTAGAGAGGSKRWWSGGTGGSTRWSGGSPNVAPSARRIGPSGWNVDGIEYRAIETGAEPHGFPDRGLTRSAGAASRLVEELRPAVLHAATTYHNLQICLALRERHELPVVYEVRGFREEMWRLRVGDKAEGSGHYEAEQAAETAAIREADMVVTLSEGMRRNLLERGEMDAERIVVIPNAVDAERFVPIPRDATLAARLGIGNDPVIGYVSGFAPYEGMADLLRATAELRRRGRRVRCLLVGDGPPDERRPLEALRASLGLDHGGAILTGRVPHTDVPRYLSLIDVFVVPRTGDRISRLVTPLKPYEAMAMERAVAVSRVEALLEIVTDGETGVVFEPDDHLSLADVVEGLLDDPLRSRSLGEAARAWVVDNRSWAHNGQRYRELYERLGVA